MCSAAAAIPTRAGLVPVWPDACADACADAHVDAGISSSCCFPCTDASAGASADAGADACADAALKPYLVKKKKGSLRFPATIIGAAKAAAQSYPASETTTNILLPHHIHHAQTMATA